MSGDDDYNTNTNQKPLVSIIVPVYNAEKYIDECLQSLLTQSYKHIEIICINDGSKDASGMILERYAKTDERIKVINQENAGPSAARNKALKALRGEYILFVDSDDRIDKDAVKICTDLLENEDFDAVVFEARFFWGSALGGTSKGADVIGRIPSVINCKTDEFLPMFSNACFFCVRDRDIKTYDLSFPEGKLYEDADFTGRLLSKLNKIYWHEKPLYYYRSRTDGNLSSETGIRCLDIFKMIESAKQSFTDAGVWGNVEYCFYFWYVVCILTPFWKGKAKKADKIIRNRYYAQLKRFVNEIPKTMFMAVCSKAIEEDRTFLYGLREDVTQRDYKRIKKTLNRVSPRLRLRNFLLKASPMYKAVFDSRELIKDVLWRLNQIQDTEDSIRELIRDRSGADE